jgi:DNA-binding SARP family transcriptional activator
MRLQGSLAFRVPASYSTESSRLKSEGTMTVDIWGSESRAPVVAVFPDVSIQLLGSFRVLRSGIEIPEAAWQQRRSGKILVKLLATCAEHSLHREQIIDVLWPDLELESALNSFAKALHVARHALEPDLPPHGISSYLRLRDDVLTLDSQYVRIDADQFQMMVKSVTTTGEIAAIQSVLQLYKGELLPEDRYEEWTFSRRSILADLYADTVIALADALQHQLEFSAAIEHLQRLVEREPGREEVHQRLMRLYALSGRRQQATRQFYICRDALERELDTVPSAETEVLHDDILAERIVTKPTHDSTVLVTETKPIAPFPRFGRSLAPMVGRDRPLELLLSDLASAEQGSGGVALISGESGIGKSRLAAELAREAERRGDLVLWGTSHEEDVDFPYSELIGALEQYFVTCAPSTRSPLAAQYPQLAMLVPSLGVDSNVEAWTRPPELSASQISSEVVRLLSHFASSRPILIVLDNVHLASTSSFHLLRQLARLAVQRRWLIVATYRDEEVTIGGQFQRVAVALAREGLCRRFDLRALSRQSSDRLIGTLLSEAKPSPALLDFVCELALGNPLFIHEVILSLKESDALAIRNGRWCAPEAVIIPEKILDMVRVRVAAKTEYARHVLGLAAIAGNEFTYNYLRTAVADALSGSITDANLLDILDDAVQTGMLAERNEAYIFRYPLYRAALSEQLSDHRRAHFHEVLARIPSASQ